MAPLLLLIASLVGCGSDPLQDDVMSYQAAVQPLFVRNLVLAQGFLDVASKVKKGETDGPAIAERLSREMTPVADELAASAAKVEPRTPQVDAAHALLVKAWQDRAAAYHEMNEAWLKNDPTAFEAARKHNLQSKLDEERYVQTVNALGAPYGVIIDQFPSP